MAHKKNQKVSFSMEPAELLIIVDPRRLKQMLVNLLSNAIKFTADEGSLGLEVVRSLPEQVVRLTVWDNGIGIKPDDIPMLFQPFVQLDSSLARQNAGSGLGLVLVMRMAELHGGSVQVESVPGEGSRFTIVLPWFEPVVPPTPPVLTGRTGHLGRTATPEDIASAQGGPLVLIVDDMESLAQTSADMLQKAGFQVAVASSGQDCMKLAPIIQPDLILMDIQMPGMDGFETIRRLRTRANPRVAKVYIIALTALAMQGDRERCLEAGADDYLSKPVEFKELLTRIQGLLAKKEK